MTLLVVPRESVERVQVQVVSVLDPSADVVAFAFPASGARPVTWTAGSWDAAAVLTAGKYVATAISPTVGLTGSGASVEFAAEGTFDVYVRVTDSPEVPVRLAGTLRLI